MEMDLRIIEDYVKAIEASHFQDFCDRLLHTLYPEEYTDVRAGGRNGDMKNDGYCFMSRMFFQAHATRGESAKRTKDKIDNDFNGCITKWKEVKSFIYITNDTLIGEIENFIDELRINNPNVTIITWTPKKIISKIKDLELKDIEYIIERRLSQNSDNSTLSKMQQEQLKKDIQTALIYQTEINHFYVKFKTCLHWSLPLGGNIDKNLDSVFNYGLNFTKGIDFNRITKKLIVDIFIQNDFRRLMPNYSGVGNFNPTGFNNLLGILDYFNEQIEKHLNKYGSSTTSELTNRIEYMHNFVISTIRNIRLDLNSFANTTKQTAENIADLLILMRDDFNIMKAQYTKNIKGGYPVSIGTVTKSDSKNGSIVVESQFSRY